MGQAGPSGPGIREGRLTNVNSQRGRATPLAALIAVALLLPDTNSASLPRPGLACSVWMLPLRADRSMSLLAQPLGRTTAVPTDSVSGWDQKRMPLREGIAVRGQHTRVHSIHGAAPDAMVRYLARGDSDVVVVTWNLSGNCTIVPAPGLPLGTALQHYAAVLRPEREWVDGRPVLDVPFGYWSIYPLAHSARGWEHKPTQWLTAAEFAAFFAALPAQEEWRRDCTEALRPLVTWTRDHRSLARKNPARHPVEQLRGVCGARTKRGAGEPTGTRG